uniref:SMEK domain-containing protein n=1 Tax=Vibrio cholerae TaxID=666 RepID=UPI0015CF6C05
MNRTSYYNYIDEKIHTLAYRIDTNGKLNMLHLHMHSESFYLHLLNLLYGYELENLNKVLQNVEAIDLIDHKNKIIIQVSSTCTKNKVESALE